MVLWKNRFKWMPVLLLFYLITMIFNLINFYLANLSKWIVRIFLNPNPGSRTKIIFLRFWISAYLLKPLWNTHSTYFTQKSDSLAKKNYVTIFFVRLVDRTLFSWPLVNGRVKLENNDITGNLIGLTTFNDYASYSDTVIAVTCSFQCYWQDYSLWFCILHKL